MLLNTPEIQILSNEAVFEYYEKEIKPYFTEIDLYKEHSFIIGFDRNHNVLFVELLGIGTSNTVTINVKDVVRYPVLYNAKSIMLMHTHPADNDASEADIEITKEIGKTLKSIGIKLNDHLVLKSNGFDSINKHLIKLKEDKNDIQAVSN